MCSALSWHYPVSLVGSGTKVHIIHFNLTVDCTSDAVFVTNIIRQPGELEKKNWHENVTSSIASNGNFHEKVFKLLYDIVVLEVQLTDNHHTHPLSAALLTTDLSQCMHAKF